MYNCPRRKPVLERGRSQPTDGAAMEAEAGVGMATVSSTRRALSERSELPSEPSRYQATPHLYDPLREVFALAEYRSDKYQHGGVERRDYGQVQNPIRPWTGPQAAVHAQDDVEEQPTEHERAESGDAKHNHHYQPVAQIVGVFRFAEHWHMLKRLSLSSWLRLTRANPWPTSPPPSVFYDDRRSERENFRRALRYACGGEPRSDYRVGSQPFGLLDHAADRQRA